MSDLIQSLLNFLTGTGIWKVLFCPTGEGQGLFDLAESGWAFNPTAWQLLVMYVIVGILVYLAIVKKFEPLLLLPIAIGMMLTNLPGANLFHLDYFIADNIDFGFILHHGGFLDLLYLGVKLGIYPCLIFMGVGAGTDFGPLISNPKTLLLGAAAQLGIFLTFIVCVSSGFFTPAEAASIGIIGGADGPTAIWLTGKLAPHLLGPIAVAAYSYMALVPVIQPPIMKALTTEKERQIVMTELKPATKTQKILFPIVVTILVSLLLPSATPLVGCLMLGNLVKECGVAERLNKTMQNELMNIVTIFLGITVGATATASTFLKLDTLLIIIVGVVNSTNLTDGIDGLASSVTLVACMGLSVLGFLRMNGLAIVGGSVMIGGMIGFLLFNFHPAKVFMGDTGSLYLGGFLIGIGFSSGMPLLVLLLCMVFVLDMLTSLIQIVAIRVFHRRVFKIAPVHHQFQLMGWGEERIVYAFSAAGLLFAALAVLTVI